MKGDPQNDPARLRQRLDESERARTRAAQEDVVIDMPRRLILRSPSGAHWSLAVDDDGALVTVNLGSNPL